MKSRILEQNGL